MRGSERLLSVFQSRNGVFKYTKCPYLSNNLIPRVMPSTIVRRSVAGLLRSATSISTSGKGKKQTDGSSVLSDSGTHVAKDDHSSPTVKYFDYYYDDKSKAWKFMETNGADKTNPRRSSSWDKYDFLVIRTIPLHGTLENESVSFNITRDYLRQACKDVIRSWPGVSWNSNTLELPKEVFITFYTEFIKYAAILRGKEDITPLEAKTLSAVEILTSTIALDYGTILSDLQHLTTHGEITFDLLYAILIPQTIMVKRCSITGLPRLYQLISSTRLVEAGQTKSYRLNLESIDLVDHPTTRTVMIGKVQTTQSIHHIRGTFKISDIDAYPLQYHKDIEGLLDEVKQRGHKWLSLVGSHHRYFDGIAARTGEGGNLNRYNVRGRIVVDRVTFSYLNPDHRSPDKVESAQVFRPATPLTILDDDDILLTPNLVWGFSLADRLWFQFNVDKIEDISWSEDAFANLVLEDNRKILIYSLIEAHDEDTRLTDYIMGKGRGLVISLFGPPGVGKTFTAEATSEHLHRPIYVIGGGNLGTTAKELDRSLQGIFKVATAWKAILLIDEADAFLEERSINDLERSAMVAIFLRHMEYYQGILFVTTNRVKVFDEAFLSRVHVALNFTELSQDSKEKIWTSFIHKMGKSAAYITTEELQDLARRSSDGRVIKNAATTAHSLSLKKQEKVGYHQLLTMLEVTRGK